MINEARLCEGGELANDKIVEYLLQSIGGLLLLLGGFVLNGTRREMASLRQDHTSLRSDQSTLRTDHAALAARVHAESQANTQNIQDLKDSLCMINEKLDRLIEKR